MPETLRPRLPGAHALRIAIVGAESTGKTALARSLAERIGVETGLRCHWVGEWLRDWCDREGRTPRPDEQAAIAREQQARIDVASAMHDVLVCDTTALMTAVYSAMLFGDDSLESYAIEQHGRSAITLLTALDLPWEPDGLQRDGPQVRAPVDDAVRRLLAQHRLPWALVAGTGRARLDAALDAVAPLLRPLSATDSGIFTRLDERNASPTTQRWVCSECDSPQCEHALRRASVHAR